MRPTFQRQVKLQFSAGLPGGSVRTFSTNKAHASKPKISAKTRATFAAISSPENAHHFTAEAALKDFAHEVAKMATQNHRTLMFKFAKVAEDFINTGKITV